MLSTGKCNFCGSIWLWTPFLCGECNWKFKNPKQGEQQAKLNKLYQAFVDAYEHDYTIKR